MKIQLASIALTLCLVAAAQAAEKPATPNVLFIIADDASPSFGCYGCDWAKTPNIDRVAKAGLIFDNAYTPTAKCAPSRACILTGRNPWQLKEAGNHQSHFPAEFKAFTEALSDAGAYVGSQGKFWGPGDAKTADGKPRTWGTKRGDFKTFLAERPKDKPFFFWYGSTNPHRPYKLDSGIEAGKKPADVDHVPGFWPDNETVRKDMLDYAIEIEAYDTEVGNCLKDLDAAGETANTIVIVTSDHGMPFPRVKGHNYDMSNHVPLVVSWPGVTKTGGKHIPDFITFVDLAPTILEVLGTPIEKAGMSPITGRSFTDLLRGKSERDRSIAILGRERHDVWARPGTEAGLGYPVRGIREGNLLYLHNFKPDRWPCGNPELGLLDTDGSPTKTLINDLGEKDRYWQLCYGHRPAEELFDVATDPDCVKNLAADPAYKEIAGKMKDKLFAELKKQEDPRILGNGDVFDNYPTAKKPADDKKNFNTKKAKKKAGGLN